MKNLKTKTTHLALSLILVSGGVAAQEFKIIFGNKKLDIPEPKIAPQNDKVFNSTGTTTWTVPDGVHSISAVAIGGGGGGAGNNGADGPGSSAGGGGGLRWINDYQVSPGKELTIRVGDGGNRGCDFPSSGQKSYIENASSERFLYANGGRRGYDNDSNAHGGHGGTGISMAPQNIGGGNGGAGGDAVDNGAGAGGGGAGGYLGDGGMGGGSQGNASNGSGGAGGGGYDDNSVPPSDVTNGGGVGLYGIGENGQAATNSSRAGAGSHGEQATDNRGGLYGGGGGATEDDTNSCGNHGAQGAVRIIWGSDAYFPNNADFNR